MEICLSAFLACAQLTRRLGTHGGPKADWGSDSRQHNRSRESTNCTSTIHYSTCHNSTSHYSTTIQLSALLHPTIHYHPLTCNPTFNYPIIFHFSTIHLTTIYQFPIIQYPTLPLLYLSLSTIFLPYLSLSTIFLSTLLLSTIQVNTYYPSVPVPPPLYSYPRRRTAHFKHSFFLPLSYFKVNLPKAPSMFSTF